MLHSMYSVQLNILILPIFTSLVYTNKFYFGVIWLDEILSIQNRRFSLDTVQFRFSSSPDLAPIQSSFNTGE